MPTTHNIRQLKINKLTDAQYEQAVKSADELYLTPSDSNGIPAQSGNSGKFLTTDGTTMYWATVSGGGKFLTFTNVSASSWVADNTYTDYGYKCVLTCNGVTSSDFAYVVFAPTEFDSGNYANVCLTGTNSVTIYSKVTDSITILTIVVIGA